MRLVLGVSLAIVFSLASTLLAEDAVLIGHWPLQTDALDQAPGHLESIARQIIFESSGPGGSLANCGRFNGRDSVIEIPESRALQLGKDPFSICLYVNADAEADDIPGDLVSAYDPAARTGFHFGLYSHGGVTSSQPNTRQLHFAIDQARIESQFTDHGRLGNSVYVFALCVHNDSLYASTCHAGANEAGHVYCYEAAAGQWIDLGSPDKANAISAMCVYDGALHVASSKYRLGGSALTESDNPHFGGQVFRLGPNDEWISCGVVSSETQAIASLVVFKNELYASSLYAPAGFFRYAGSGKWDAVGTPGGKRVEALTVFNGAVYATSYDEGSVFRFDGQSWQSAGVIPNATQTYGFAVHRGELYVSEWPQARVFRYVGGMNWVDCGKLGQELESMPLLVYNGTIYGGTLPSAEVYRYDGETTWSSIGRVDFTADVKYRRAWSMAVFKGRLFVGTLPGGRVLSIEAGRNVTYDKSWPRGWHHVAAIRQHHCLELYVDGEFVGRSAQLTDVDYDLAHDKPLHIGFGAQDYFCGRMADVRIYRGAMTQDQIRALIEDR